MSAWRWMVCAVVVLAGTGCAVGIGQPCGEAECPSGLVCTFPTSGSGEPLAQGICDYPLLPEGEACTAAAQCAGTLTCSNHFDEGGRYGQCVPRLAPGSTCFAARDCVSNKCNGASGTALDGTCQ